VLACSQQGPSGSTGHANPTPRPTSPAAGTATPSPEPSVPVPLLGQSYGVLGTSGTGQPNYSLAIVDASARVAAVASAAPRSGLQCVPAAGPILPFPTVSTTDSRVYYLDGNTAVKFLRP